MVARLKLKGIDGGSHKRWRMWLNSSYAKNLILVLTYLSKVVKAIEWSNPQLVQVLHGCRQLVS